MTRSAVFERGGEGVVAEFGERARCDAGAVRCDRRNGPREPRGTARYQRYAASERSRDERGLRACRACADHDDGGARNLVHAGQQHARTATVRSERQRACEGRKPPGDARHRRQQGRDTLRVADRLEGQHAHTRREHCGKQRGIAAELREAADRRPCDQARVLRRLQLLHLDDEVA